jgi:hypothetical protein
MALPAYSADIQAPSDRLHYFHPFRIAIAALVIIAADLGLTFWASGGHSGSLVARTSLLVVLLLAGVGRTFQPRTLSSDAVEIRWKKALQPAMTVPRHEVAAIQYLTTARPGGSRYYFVNRDGKAVLSVDRFTPARMGSFASYLGITLRAVSVAPPTSAAADAAVKAGAIVGARRSGMVAMGVCTAISLAGTVASVFWVEHEGAVLAAYERAPLCERPAADPLACRFDAPAVVTAWNSKGRIDIRFLKDVPTFRFRTTWVYIADGAVPHPGFGVGDTVQIEIFDGRALAINGATTDGFNTLQSNASWLLVPATGLFLIFCLIGMVLCWKGPDAWFVNTARRAVSSKPTLNDPPSVTDTPGPNEKPGAIERAPIPGSSADPGDGWPTLVQNPGFDRAAFEADPGSSGIPGANERLLARAPVRYYGVAGTGSMLLTDQRLVVLGPTRLEIPRTRITLIAYWTVKDSIAVTYRTMDGPHGILVTGPQLVLTGGPKTDMHRLFEAMRIALTNPDAILTPVVIMRSPGRLGRSMQAVGRVSHRVWLAWVG